MQSVLVATLSGLMMGVIILVFVVPAFWSRKWSARRDFRRALAGQGRQFKSARFDAHENLEAFRTVLAAELSAPLGSRQISAVRSVAPELAVFLELQAGKKIGNALSELAQELQKGRDQWWGSVERAERERGRFIERANAIREGSSTKGECPSCGWVIPLSSEECLKCGASFSGESAWRVRPL